MKSWLPLITLFFLFHVRANGQTGSIHGVAKDIQGVGIPKASIVLEGTSYGALTDESGNYRITNVNAGSYTIHFTSIGFQAISRTVFVAAYETVQANFECTEEISMLDEATVTGIKAITGMGYLNEIHDGVIYSGKKTEVLILDSLDANTAQNNPRQVLGRVPGANYSETEGSGFPNNGIGFRGLNPTQSIETNTRQNGYNITADLYGYPESYYLPPLEAVERIEVTRGASSLQYGAQFGGVINYILKHGSVERPVTFTTQQTGGSFGLFNSFNAIGGQIGKLNYYGYLQYQTSQGWRPNSDFWKLTGFGKLEYQATKKLKFGIEYSFLRNQIHMPGGFTDSLFAANSQASYRSRNWLKSPWNIFAATLEWKISNATTFYVKSALNQSARNLVWRNEDGGPQAMDDIDPSTNQYSNREVEHEGFTSSTTELRMISNYALGRISGTLTSGVRFYDGYQKRQEGGEGTTGTDFDMTLAGPYETDLNFTTLNIAPYLENTFRLGKKWSVTPGLRYEFIRSTIKGYYENEMTGSISYSDQARNRSFLVAGMALQFKASSTTNLYANLTEAYRPLDYSSLTPLGTIVTVDPQLKDSRGYNADAGYRGSIKNYLNFDVGAFYLKVNDRVGIVEKTDAQGNPYPFRTNVANSVHQGMETYVEFNPVKAFSSITRWSLSFFNALALIDAKYMSGEFRGKSVEYAPRRIERIGTSMAIGKFSTTFLISSTSKSFSDAANSEVPSADAIAGPIPAYTVMDWSGTFSIRNFNLKFGCNNVADRRYYTLRTGEYPGPGIIPSIGRGFYFGIGAKF